MVSSSCATALQSYLSNGVSVHYSEPPALTAVTPVAHPSCTSDIFCCAASNRGFLSIVLVLKSGLYFQWIFMHSVQKVREVRSAAAISYLQWDFNFLSLLELVVHLGAEDIRQLCSAGALRKQILTFWFASKSIPFIVNFILGQTHLVRGACIIGFWSLGLICSK